MQIRIEEPYESGYIKYLYVNEVHIGTQFKDSTTKDYLNPEKWAEKQLKKRLAVIDRNIKRLEKELKKWKDEGIKLTYEDPRQITIRYETT